MSKLPVSVFMIIKNEEENLQECLEKLLWADELIIVDTGSSDKSIEIAKKFTNKVFIEKWEGFGKTKNKALLHTNLDWVFSIDADERVTNDLKNEIETAIKNERIDGYYIKRLPYFLGKPVFHGGWYPGWVLRLFKKKKGRFSNNDIHEKIELEGKTAFLENDLIHLTYPTVEEYIRKLNIYTTISAKEVLNDGKQAKMIDIFVRPAALFIKMYLLKMGFLDGINGFVLAVFSSIYPLLKYSKAYFFEKKQRMNDKKKNRKILVIKSRGLGDTVLMIPFLENLKSYFSESDIDVMINEKYIDLLKSIDFIHNFTGYKKNPFTLRLLHNIRNKKYDLIINLHSSATSEWLTKFSAAKSKIIHNHNGLLKGDLEIPKAAERIYGHWRDLLVLEAMDIPYVRKLPVISISEVQKRLSYDFLQINNIKEGTVFIAPFASCDSKTWELKKFIELADQISETGYNVAFIAEDKNQEITGKYKVIISDNLPLLAGVISSGKCFIGNDTGIAHIASATGIPVIIIFGPSSVDEWFPYSSSRNKAIQIDVSCRGEGCGKRECIDKACLNEIDANRVFNEFLGMFEQSNG